MTAGGTAASAPDIPFELTGPPQAGLLLRLR